jgi:uncharacterized protein YkwD
MKTFIFALILGLIIVIASVVAANDSRAYGISQDAIITQTNQNRASQLIPDSILTKAAQAKADDMASKGYFSHMSPTGKSPWSFIKDQNYRYKVAGENLAVYFTDTQTLVNAWMNSPSHKQNIINPQFTHTGVGIAEGLYKGYRTYFIVQLFALPVTNSQ